MSAPEVPSAPIRRRPWLGVAVWIVPLVALAVAGWLVWQHYENRGQEITIRFSDGSGLRVGITPLKYRGVPVGEVTALELSPDNKQVLVKARLRKDARELARDGAVFWILRPQVGFGNVSGLNTVISGPEIQMLAGSGEPRTDFTGIEDPPVAMGAKGLPVVLKAERPRSLRPNAPVYYRGVEVGVVQKIDLAPNATAADVRILVWERYAQLVRTGSAFWMVNGASVKGGIFQGLELELDSLRTLVQGGVEFASPPGAPRAPANTVFFLHDGPRREWLGWNAKFRIPQEKSD